MFAIKFTEDAVADIKALPKNVRNSLKGEFQRVLARDPYGCSVALREPLEGWRSFHWKKYRIVFKVYDDLKIIAVGGVGERAPRSRGVIYRRLEVLAADGKLAAKVLAVLRGYSSE